MAEKKLPELVFIIYPEISHLLPSIQLAERLISQSSNQISAVIPVMKSPDEKLNSYVQSLKGKGSESLTLLELPPLSDETSTNTLVRLVSLVEAYQIIIEQILRDRYEASSTLRLAGFVLDMFCTGMMDIADKLGVPFYVFFTSGAALLNLGFRLEALHVDIPAVFGNELREQTVIEVGGFENPVSMNVWPRIFLDKEGGSKMIFNHITRFRQTKGIMVNTFMALESSLIQSLSSSDSTTNHGFGHVPPIYPVGPILNLHNNDTVSKNRDYIMNWLDSQPDSSVVFLCFGGRGSFIEEQVKEIAAGLERSGQRFLWSLRKPHGKGGDPGEYDDFNEVLPEEFLTRTTGVGKVIGWAPQVAVLSHKAVGAFVSHCGWNSTLESLWFGVPMLTWPMYAEQQLNAFELVKELGLAVEIKLDYVSEPRKEVPNMVVRAEEVEIGIRKMMVEEEGVRVRKKVKKMSEEGRKAMLKAGGSSYQAIGRFLEDVHNSVS